jgi:2-amino-4-hydroxy-6-hydroxymethyldihydropteridine diphosphokinase
MMENPKSTGTYGVMTQHFRQNLPVTLDAGVLVALGFGANMQQPEQHIHQAISAFSLREGVVLLAQSDAFITAPHECPPGTPAFHNAVALFKTTLQPKTILSITQHLEVQAGREPVGMRIRNGSRPLDVDMLFYGTACISELELTVPHPRMHTRGFVLHPLQQCLERTGETWMHPVFQKTTPELILALSV